MSTTLEIPPLLTVAEAASRLRISPATLYRWIDERRLRAVRLGDGPCARLRIEPAELERFIEEASAGAPGTARVPAAVEALAAPAEVSR